MNIETLLSQIKFDLSAVKLEQLPFDDGYEVVFVGRSNSGKSSCLNTFTRKGMANTSKTPGRTQQINVFSLDETRRLIDMPGYGYAKVPPKIKKHWEALMDDYFRERRCLRGIFMIMDIRHPLKDFDIIMMEWAVASQIPLHILLNKADKLTFSESTKTLLEVNKAIAPYAPHVTAQVFSAEKKTGLAIAYKILKPWFGIN